MFSLKVYRGLAIGLILPLSGCVLDSVYRVDKPIEHAEVYADLPAIEEIGGEGSIKNNDPEIELSKYKADMKGCIQK